MLGEITLEPREVKLTTRTNTIVRRTLPYRDLLMIGPWCFIDHYGPTQAVEAMSVASHPHTGLQTVSWLFAGEIEHRDSLGSSQLINPGELNLMTSGFGIAHSELSIDNGSELHGVQLWVALPNESKDVSPHFEHHGNLPEFSVSGLNFKLFMGEFLGNKSDARTYSPLVGLEMSGESIDTKLPVNSNFEHGILLDSGQLEVNGQLVTKSQLHYIPNGAESFHIKSDSNFRALLIGGEPFSEKIVMWWNFIGRSHEEIVAMRNDWENQTARFATFEDKIGGRIPAPEMPNVVLKERGNQRSS